MSISHIRRSLWIRTVSDSSLTLTYLANNRCSINLIYIYVYIGSNSLITEEITTIQPVEKSTSLLQNINAQTREKGIVHNQALNQNPEYVTLLLNTDRCKVHVVPKGFLCSILLRQFSPAPLSLLSLILKHRSGTY